MCPYFNLFMDDTSLRSTVLSGFDAFNVINVLEMGFQSRCQLFFTDYINNLLNFTLCEHRFGL